MLKTYFLVALRILRKNKVYAGLNILGLSIGVAASVLIFLVIGWETGFAISAPLGYAVMQHWLNGFYYHVPLGWGVFALTLAASLAIAGITVGYKALLAALVNSANSLKGQ